MAYQLIPQPTDTLNQSQADILENFTQIQTGFALNHIDFDNGSETGKHKFIQMPQQTSAPTTNMTEMALYTKDVSGTPQLFLKTSNNLNEYNISGLNAPTTSEGWTILPSGLRLVWGSFTANGSTPAVFPAGLPAFNQIYSVQVSALRTGGSSDVAATIGGISPTTFTVFGTNSQGNMNKNVLVRYIAIGV